MLRRNMAQLSYITWKMLAECVHQFHLLAHSSCIQNVRATSCCAVAYITISRTKTSSGTVREKSQQLSKYFAKQRFIPCGVKSVPAIVENKVASSFCLNDRGMKPILCSAATYAYFKYFFLNSFENLRKLHYVFINFRCSYATFVHLVNTFLSLVKR